MASSNSTSSFTAVNDTDFSQLDLNGKIIIKAQFNDDIRRIPIIGDEITYDELLLMMQRLFKLQSTDDIHIKYRDDDNDFISIIDDNDLSFAIQYSRILKLKVYVNNKNKASSNNENDSSVNVININNNNFKAICHELIEIRNRCNKLLEKIHLDDNKKTNSNLANDQSSSATLDTNEVHTQTDRNEKQMEQPKIYGQPPKELDPLNNVDNKSESGGYQPQQQSNQQQLQASNETKNVEQSDNNAVKSGFSPIAQQPVLQQAYPAPPVRPPMTNQFHQPQQPPFANQPGDFSNSNQSQQPYFEPPRSQGGPVPPPPTSSTGPSFTPNAYNPMTSMPGPMPPPTSFAGSAPPMSAPPTSFAPSGPGAPPPPFMGFGGPPPPPTSQHMMRPGPTMTPGHHGPPSVGFNPPPPPTMGSDPNKMPPTSAPMGMHQPPPQMPPMQSPPGNQMPPPPPTQMGMVDPSKQQMQMGPPMPPSSTSQQPGMAGGVPPPPMMPQFNPRGPGGFSYGVNNIRTRYPTSG